MLAPIASLLVAVSVIAAPPADDAVSRERLERMLTDGDNAMIVQTFARHPDRVLGFVDSYLEGGLKMIEDGESRDTALASFRTGIKFAEFANEAFRETIFLDYAATFASWSPKEQKAFRDGQRLYKQGRDALKADDLEGGQLAAFEESLAAAEPLNDFWGTSMAYAGIGECHLRMGDYRRADETARSSTLLNARLRLRRARISSLLVSSRARAKQGLADSGLGHMQQAWNLLRDPDSRELRDEVLREYIGALERTGKFDVVEELKAEHGDPG